MLHPNIAQTLVAARQQRYLQEAEAERLYRQIQGKKPRLVKHLNNVLAATGLLVMVFSASGRK